MSKAMLAPAAVLVLWTLIMVGWTAVSRFSAFSQAGVSLKGAAPGGRGQDLEGVLPPQTNWKSHNYSHLVEQPTIFYPAVIILAVAGGESQINLTLAWAYVGLRILHSLWQALINTIPVRFTLFALSTACLIGLSINAVVLTLT
ncbi:MAPEG family protein [Sphingomonas lacunae]|uniref:MAPEG family protein n=2 Tax=Sphingomonas lacunae TaxID=2698828 RepID=A0A6M4AXM3_9SPHN|nr:MAPEG family protein [Sphingomonas lacunae]QJQ33755.1 MAPEG family protein [Sphingomonas lacunae]